MISNIAALLGGVVGIAPGTPAAPCMPHVRKRS
jgi:hypothetical protein